MAADKEMTIKLRFDKTEAEAGSKDFHAAEKLRIEQTQRAAVSGKEAEAAAAKKAGDARVKAARDAGKAEEDSAGKSKRSLDDIVEGVGNVVATFGKLAVGAQVFRTLSAEVNNYLGAMAQGVKVMESQIDQYLKLKDILRELSAITGGTGPGTAEIQKHLDIRKASGLSTDEAAKFALEFAGAGEATKGRNISEAEYGRLQGMSARYAATQGGGPDAAGTYGKQMGLLLGVGKYKTAEEALATQMQFNRILSLGVGENPVLVKQQAQVAGAFLKENGPGIVGDTRELAALTAVASRINPEQSAEMLKSSARVTRGFSEKWGGFLKSAGVTEKDTMTVALNKIFAKIQEAESKGRAGDVYLGEQGLDQHARNAVMNLYGNRNFLNGIMQDEAEKMTGEQAVAELDRKFTSDPSLQIKQQQAKLDEAKLHNAEALQYGRLLRIQAETRLEQRGEGESSGYARAEDRLVGQTATGFFGIGLPAGTTEEELGRKIRVEQEMHAITKEKGIKMPGRPEPMSMSGGYSKEYLNWVAQGGMEQDYAQAGSELDLHAQLNVPVPGNRRFGAPIAPSAPDTMMNYGDGSPDALGLGGTGEGAPVVKEIQGLRKDMAERANERKQAPPAIKSRPTVKN